MQSVYVPNSYDPQPKTKVIFLAGPIAWGGGWQIEAARHLLKRLPDVSIAMPIREIPADLAKLKVRGDVVTERQLDWEQAMLEIAGSRGVVLFWLPDKREYPVPPYPSRSYARDTRGELGIWMTEAKYRPEIRVVIGAEDEFDGASVIERNVKKQWSLASLSFPKTLEASCERAIEVLRARDTALSRT